MSDFLLAAIREQPADGLARLAYADWLEENGETDRAAFIRLQMELDSQPTRSPRAGELAVEAEGMLAAFERDWLGEWADLLVRWTFKRGFLDNVVIEPEVFLARGVELFARHPIREVRFVGPDGNACGGEIAKEVVAAPHFAFVRAVDVSGATPSAAPAWCRALARARRLRYLEELNLSSAWQPDATFADHDSLRDLCLAEHLRSLTKLDLSSPLAAEVFGDEGVAMLLQAPFLSGLTALNLGGWQMTDPSLRALATCRG